ncbi:outer membrane transport energization protein ExbD [Palleronia marisminoris]|uniref:Biopolymer transport protein ExbD/TolR n=2 Tax=Palleronia marisminoris TaxID=315423 RepID=A0A1Y5TLH3_9RHOB|nr:outer membrane transport energization protein ExbD [Palleronia marisminoris]SLN66666.1 Biopolymer transport protein ExbD/TolR [Palleronia marisminoris]
MSLTSLIDVIFLLLLFFMLTSTFTRFAEVELAAAAAGTGAASDAAPLFLRLAEDDVSLNGDSYALDGLGDALANAGEDETPRTLLVSLAEGVTAQRLTDLLGVLRGVPNVAPQVLGGS